MTRPASRTQTIGAILIGRNEGDRLIRGLASIGAGVTPVVYVDSGSEDGSVAAARAAGAEIVQLDTGQPFTAARARNAGLEALKTHARPPDLVQFIDGDCELRDGWIAAAAAFLGTHPDVAAICGRRRERHPDATLYNRLIDREWDTPIGEARACGGDVMMRLAALDEVGGYNPHLIAGEEPELCVRLRQVGWKIWRLDAEMTWHDANMTRFAQWWTRSRRAGHAFAEGAALHGAPPERHNVAQTRRALIWTGGTVAVILAGVLATPWALLGLLAWPLQIWRLARRLDDPVQAGFVMLGKWPETLGILSYRWSRLTGRRKTLIEYK